MKSERFERALNYLDDDLISEAADYVPKRKAKPFPIFKYSAAAAACLAVIFGGVIAVKTAVTNDQTASLTDPESTDSFIDIPQSSGSSASSPMTSDYIFPANLPEWIDDPDVIWDDSDGLKEYPDQKNHSGITYSDRLTDLIGKYPDSVFAVKVSFELDKTERENWKFAGTSIAEYRNELKAAELEPPDPEENTGSDTEYQSKVDLLKEKLQLAIYDHYYSKCVSFLETFQANNVEFCVITSPEATGTEDYNYFLCFMTAEQLNAFTAKPTEKLMFDIMPRANAEFIF